MSSTGNGAFKRENITYVSCGKERNKKEPKNKERMIHTYILYTERLKQVGVSML